MPGFPLHTVTAAASGAAETVWTPEPQTPVLGSPSSGASPEQEGHPRQMCGRRPLPVTRAPLTSQRAVWGGRRAGPLPRQTPLPPALQGLREGWAFQSPFWDAGSWGDAHPRLRGAARRSFPQLCHPGGPCPSQPPPQGSCRPSPCSTQARLGPASSQSPQRRLDHRGDTSLSWSVFA